MKLNKKLEIMILLVMAFLMIGVGPVVADEVGPDFTDYEEPEGCDITVVDGDSIKTKVEDADEQETVCVEAGTYGSGDTIKIENSLTIVAKNSPEPGSRALVEAEFRIFADGVTIKGLKIDVPDDKRGIRSKNSANDNILIRDNIIVGFNNTSDSSDNGKQGIRINGGSVDILNNRIVAETGKDDYSGDSIYLNGTNTKLEATVRHNELSNNKYGPNHKTDRPDPSTWQTAAGLSVHTNCNVTAEYNLIENNDFGIHIAGNEKGKGTPTFTANNNSIKVGNTFGFFYEEIQEINEAKLPFDLENNYWGSSAGPDITSNTYNENSQGAEVKTDASVSDYIDYTPWLKSEDGISFAPVENTDTGEQFPSINTAISYSDTGSDDIIEAEPGTYEENVNLNKKLTLIGKNSPEGSNPAVLYGTIEVSAEDAALKNMKIAPQETFLPGGLDPHGILVTASGVLIEKNVVEGLEGDSSYIEKPELGENAYPVTLNGIQVWSDDPSVREVVIKDNIVRDMHNKGGDSWPYYGGAAAIKVQGVLDGTEVIGNKVENIYSAGWAYGVVTTQTGNAPGISPQDTLVKGNTISKVNNGSKYNVSEDPAAAPYPGTAFCVDGEEEIGFSKADEVVVHRNNFLDTPIGVLNKDEENTLDAQNNYWDHASGPSGENGRTNPAGKVVGKGVTVVGDVDWNPWLPKPVGRAESPGVVNPGPPGKKGPKVKSFSVTPNPTRSNQRVTFQAQGSEVSQVRVKVFNTVGAQVYDSNFQNGSTVSWNLVGKSGEKVSNGLYLFALSAEVDGEVQKSEVRRLLVIK